MERVKYDVIVGSLEYEQLKKQNEIVDWINEHERVFHGMTPPDKERIEFTEENQLDNIVEDLIKIRKKAREIRGFTADIVDKIDEIRKRKK